MKNLLNRINKSRTMGVAAFLISLSYFLSRILGLVRDRLLATNFGVSAQTDAYTAAFRIPDLLFTIIVSGAFAVAFIPVFIGYLEKKKETEAWHIANSILNLIFITTSAFAILAFIFVGPLVKLLAPGFDAYRYTLTVNITRIMLLTPILFGISSVFGAIQQSFNRFVLYAMSSLFYNVGIIIGILFLSKLFPGEPIYGVAWGVVLGTAMQAMVQFIGVLGLGYKYAFYFHFLHRGVIRIVKLMIPRSLDLGIDQINWIVQTAIASHLSSGSLAAYYYANNLKNVPVVLFGAAMSTAFFPNLIRAAKAKDRSKLPAAIVCDMSLLMFLVFPSAVIAIVLRGYIVRILFGFGDQATADALGWLGVSIVAQSLDFMIARAFYALEDTKTPLFISIFTIGFNIALSIPLANKYGISGLAMALSLSSAIELALLLIFLGRRMGNYGINSILKLGLRIFLASAASGLVMYAMVRYIFPLYKADLGFMSLTPKFILISAAGVMTYVLAGQALRIKEVHKVLSLLKKRFNKIVHYHG